MNNWFAAAAAGVLALLGGHGSTTADHRPPPFQHDQASTSRQHDGDRLASSTPRDAVNVQCVAAAVAARESALGTAITTYGASISSAYSARATALASAFALTDRSAIKAASKSAWTQFRGAMSASKKGWQNSKEGAWNTFRAAVKACGGAASSIVDQSSSAGELSGQ